MSVHRKQAILWTCALAIAVICCAGHTQNLKRKHNHINVQNQALQQYLNPAETAFLLRELARITPPKRIRELAACADRQADQGGGFFGLLPSPHPEESFETSFQNKVDLNKAAIAMARKRSSNLAAIAKIDPNYALAFQGKPMPDWPSQSIQGVSLHLDFSPLRGFLEALQNGEINPAAAQKLVQLPANREMLNHRNALAYMPTPKVTAKSLTRMIVQAGSRDPLERLWSWLHPMNNFGYADLVVKSNEYAVFLDELERNSDRLTNRALANVVAYGPPKIRLNETFAFTIGFFVRGWATSTMAGLNIEQAKDKWSIILGTLIEETYHRLQLGICPTSIGHKASRFGELATADLGDPRYDKLYEAITYTVLEGAANRARGSAIASKIPERFRDGIALMDEIVKRVIIDQKLSVADELMARGLRSNGPLYSLGWYWADLIVDDGGTHAVGELQTQGPVAFAHRACLLAQAANKPSVSTETMTAIVKLESLLKLARQH